MKDLALFWSQLLRDGTAQDLVEYALVAAIVGLGAVASLSGLANSVTAVFASVGSTLTSSF